MSLGNLRAGLRGVPRALLVALAILSSPAGAAEEWPIVLGQRCEEVLGSELDRRSAFAGSVPREEISGFFAIFDRIVLGRGTRLSYLCGDGVVVSQAAFVAVDSESDGGSAVSDWTALLDATLGVRPEEAGERAVAELSAAENRAVGRMMLWELESGRVELELGTAIGGGWLVTVVAASHAAGRESVRRWGGAPTYRGVAQGARCPERWVYTFDAPPDDGVYPDGYLFYFSPEGQLCMARDWSRSTAVVHPAWSEVPLVLTYPPEAQLEDLEGHAILAITVDADGTVLETSVLEASDPRFGRAVLDAHRDLRVDVRTFDPERFPYTHRVRYTFRLEDFAGPGARPRGGR